MLMFQVSCLLNSFSEHVHQAKTTLPDSISLKVQAKQESNICFTDAKEYHF